MIIKINRWQPRTNRYQIQTIQLDNESPFVLLDIVMQRGQTGELTKETGTKRMEMRTHRIDRIMMSNENDTPFVELWTSPIVERTYNETTVLSKIAATTAKPGKTDILCSGCYHAQRDHAGTEGLCLMPGCPCKRFTQLEKWEARQVIDAARQAKIEALDDDIPF